MAVNREAAEFGKWGGESWWGAGVAWWGWPVESRLPGASVVPPPSSPNYPRKWGSRGFPF